MASLHVLADAFLFRRITAFQRGLEMPLFQFWRAHTPGDAPLRLTDTTSQDLVQLLIAHGSPALFAMAQRAKYCVMVSAFFGSGPSISLRPLSLYHVADYALQRNQPEIVEWALASKISSLHDTKEAWYTAMKKCACEDGDTRMLDVLKTHAPLHDKKEMDSVIQGSVFLVKHVSMFRWLLDEVPGFQIPSWRVGYAANGGNLPMLHFLHEHGLTSCDHGQMAKALSDRRFDVLECLLEYFSERIDPYDAEAIAANDDPEVQRIALRFAEKLQVGCIEYINNRSGRSALQVQLWIMRGILSPQWPISIDTAASNGRLDIVRLLHDNGIAIATTDAMDRAAESGKWDVFEFLHYNRSEGCTTRAMDAALAQGHLKYVKFLYENRSDGFSPTGGRNSGVEWINGHYSLSVPTEVAFTSAVMDKAAARGRVAVVKYLHENRLEGCTTATMDEACVNGHLRVVQYLHRHRSEGCTIAAVRGSLHNGFLDIARFLFDNYRHLFECDAFDEALVTSAARSALKPNGNLALVQFLFDHFPHLFSPDLLHDVLLRGMFDIYSALRIKYPEQADAVLESVLYEAGRSLELPTIRFIIEELGRRDLAHRAMDGAASKYRNGWTHWLRAVYAICGPESCRLSAVRLAAECLRSSSFRLGDSVAYLAGICCEPDAQGLVIGELGFHKWNAAAEHAKVACELPLHPFLVHPQTSRWALRHLFDITLSQYVTVRHVVGRSSWPIQAAYHDDMTMLKILRDMRPTPNGTDAGYNTTTGLEEDDKLFSFEGARAAAARTGNLASLQWLLQHIDLPVEPTLLGEAVFYDQREIAEWLVTRHPEACTKVHWESWRERTPNFAFDLFGDVLDWLDEHDAVRDALDFDGVVDYLVAVDDVDALRRLHTWNPDLLMARTDLLELERRSLTSDVVGWLQDIGYRGN